MNEDLLAPLMARVARDLDRNAFSQLFDALAPLVKGRLMRGGMDAAGAEDVMQDVMLSVWTKAGLYDQARGSVYAWVFTIARNARIDRARRERPATSLDMIEWDPIDEHDNAEEALGKGGEAKALQEALKSVSDEQREILEMAFVKELTQAEIAQKLALPLGTVKSRMRLAYAHLRKCLEKIS